MQSRQLRRTTFYKRGGRSGRGRVDGEDGRREDHSERQHSQQVMVAISLGREQPHQHYEQDQVDSGAEEFVRNEKFIGDKENYAADGQEIRPTLGEQYSTTAHQSVSAKEQSRGHKYDGRNIKTAGRGQGSEAGEDQQIEDDIEVAADGRCQGEVCRLRGRYHVELILLTFWGAA